jgi:hypothetical protein
MQVGKTRAIGVNLEYRALATAAACRRRSIQNVSAQNQSATWNIAATRLRPVAIRVETGRISDCCGREIIQIRVLLESSGDFSLARLSEG